MKRIYYYVDQGQDAFDHVLLARPKGEGDVFVYCPPSIDHGPWCERYSDFESAMYLAELLVKQAGQPVVLLTQDATEWWLKNLTVIGNADEYFREDREEG